MRSKGFKVSTAIINFYLPLLVLICLNGRIYYEIKRRYKNILLQRHSNSLNESTSSNQKLNLLRKNSHLPITVTLCDSDKQICSTTENDSLIISKHLTIQQTNNTKLRINFKEKKNRSNIPIQITDKRRSSSFIEKTHCTHVISKINK